jgi:thiosulfate/3-mercaptopyruvate sulfurtransferase
MGLLHMSCARLPLLTEPESLQNDLGKADVLVVDMRAPDNYLAGHIPGAVNLSYTDIIAINPPAMGLLPDGAHLSAVFSAIGLEKQHYVIAYDDEGGGRASRLLWTLDVLGHRAFSLLNGGLYAWSEQNGPLEQRVTHRTPSHYRAKLANPSAMADKDYILARLGQDDLVLLDTRSADEYTGRDRRAARAGCIPGAVNMNWTEAMGSPPCLRFKPDILLRQKLINRGVTPDKEVIVYCQTHHRSAHTYMVLKHLGYDRVRGYAGAWSEWGNDPDVPVDLKSLA